MAAQDSGGAERQPGSLNRFNRQMIETQEAEGNWDCGKNLSYYG